MPTNTIYVGRPTRWGNPFRGGVHGDAEQCVAAFSEWVAGARLGESFPPSIEDIRVKLGGKNLACWCAIGAPCHADAAPLCQPSKNSLGGIRTPDQGIMSPSVFCHFPRSKIALHYIS